MGTYQPFEPPLPGFALEPKLLGERPELLLRSAVIVAIEDIEIVEVGVLAADIVVAAIGTDRGQLRADEIITDLGRDAVILDILALRAARRDRPLLTEPVHTVPTHHPPTP